MNWKNVRLEEIIEKPIIGEWGQEGNDVAVLRTTNFKNDGSINLTEVVRRRISKDKIAKKKLQPGDTILEKSGGSPSQPVGRVVYFDLNGSNEYLCNNFTTILRPKSLASPKYLFWFLFGNHLSKKTLKYQNKTTGIINLQTERYLKEIRIPLPPLFIQQKIATILDKADELRKKDQQLLAKYDELVQSIFYDMFGDPVKNDKGWTIGTLRDMVSEVKYGTSKPSDDTGKYPYLRMNNITYSGEWNFTDLKYINLSEDEKSKYLLRKNDLVFNRTNSKELVGKTAVYQRDDEMAIAGYLIRIRTNEKANPFYLSAFLNSKHGKTILRNMCKNIIGMANINAQELQDIRILMPPIVLQKRFEATVQKVIIQKKHLSQQIEKSETLFAALLQNSFNI